MGLDRLGSRAVRAEDGERVAHGLDETRPGAADETKAALPGLGGPQGAAWPETPAVDFAKYGPVETLPLSRIKRISGPRLHASWVNIPHVTHSDEADITELETFRKRPRPRGQSGQDINN